MLQLPIAPLVLQEFHVEEFSPTSAGPNLRIRGRPAGLINFVLSHAAFIESTTLIVDAVEVRLDRSSLFSKECHVLPTDRVDSVFGGVQSPLRFLVFAGVFSVLAAISAVSLMHPEGLILNLIYFSTWTLLAITCAVLFILRKSFYIAFQASGGIPIIVFFQPNVIEGVPVDYEQTLQALEVCRELILRTSPSESPLPIELPAQDVKRGESPAAARLISAAPAPSAPPALRIERPAPPMEVRPPPFGAPFPSPAVSAKAVEERGDAVKLPPPAAASEMEQITVSCPHCKKKLRIRTSQLGKKRTCPSCNQSFNA